MSLLIYENITTMAGKLSRSDMTGFGIFGFKLLGSVDKPLIDRTITAMVEGVNNAYLSTFKHENGETHVAVVLHQPGIAFSREIQAEVLSPKCVATLAKVVDLPALNAPKPETQNASNTTAPAGISPVETNSSPAAISAGFPDGMVNGQPQSHQGTVAGASDGVSSGVASNMVELAQPQPGPRAQQVPSVVAPGMFPPPPTIPAQAAAAQPSGIPAPFAMPTPTATPTPPAVTAPQPPAAVPIPHPQAAAPQPVVVQPVITQPVAAQASSTGVPVPAIIAPDVLVRQLVAQMPQAAPTDILMSARAQYIKHYQNYLETTFSKPVNLLKDDEWRACGFEPFKITLTNLDSILKPSADIATQTPAVPLPAAPSQITPAQEDEDMSTFSPGSYVKVIGGPLLGSKGIIQSHDTVKAIINLENGTTVCVELAQLARTRRNTEPAATPQATQAAAAVPGKPVAAAPATTTTPPTTTTPATAPAPQGSATAQTTPAKSKAPKKAPAAPGNAPAGSVTYKFKIVIRGKASGDETEYPTSAAAEAAAAKKIEALKVLLPEETPSVKLEEVQKANYSLTIIGEEPMVGDYDGLLHLADHTLRTLPVIKFASGVALEVKNKNKFLTDLAEKSGVDIKIIRAIFT